MSFTCTPIPVLNDNYAWVLGMPGSEAVAVVDPGEAPPVLTWLDQHGLRLAAILLTHRHADHVGGVPELVGPSAVPVFGPARDSIPGVTRPVTEGDRVVVTEAGLELETIEVPGHTSGHVAYLGPDCVLCGDTLFAAGCGRVFEGTPEQMYGSLQRLAALPSHTRVCCAHEYTITNLEFALTVEPGNPELQRRLENAREARAAARPTVPTTIGDELRCNPFLRCDQEEIAAAATRSSGRTLTEPAEVFAAIRAMKDRF